MHSGIMPEIVAYDYRPCHESEQPQQLMALLDAFQLAETPVHLILTPKNYQLLMIDAPGVPKEELLSALQWKLRDLIDFPMEDATIDYFDIPAKRASDDGKLGFVVVSKTNQIMELQQAVTQAGYNLKSIDIPEMAIRNLALLGNFGTKPTAIVRLTNRGGNVIYMREGMIFMNRQFELSLELLLESEFDDNEEAHSIQESLALEIQRSIDYCASYLRQPVATEIVLTPINKEHPAFLTYIHQTLGIEVVSMDFNQMFSHRAPIERERQNRCLLAFGGAIRDFRGDI